MKEQRVIVTKRTLSEVIAYLYKDEHKDWLECGKPAKHIFKAISKLAKEIIKGSNQIEDKYDDDFEGVKNYE